MGRMPSKISKRLERLALAGIVIRYFMLRLIGLREQPLNSLFDEGIYFSLMKMLAEGQGILYRDFVVAHPPGL